jgi:Protein of unknown function (DUF4232)
MRRWIALVVMISIAACSPALPPIPSSALAPEPSTSGSSPQDFTKASPTPAASRPTLLPAALPTVSIGLDAAPYVFYSGDPVTFTVSGSTIGTIYQEVDVRSATIAFGDGRSVQTGDLCGGGSPVLHTYSRSGRLTARVTTATLCSPMDAIDLSMATTGVAVLAAAPVASTGWPTCTTFQLQLSIASLGAGMGHVGDLVRLQNRSSRSCQLTGYPALTLIAPDGDRMPTKSRAAVDGAYLFPALAARRVALVPGFYASFEIGYNDEPSGAEPYAVGCPLAASLRVTLPGTDEYGTVRASIAPCEGSIDVAPLVSGPGWAGL